MIFILNNLYILHYIYSSMYIIRKNEKKSRKIKKIIVSVRDAFKNIFLRWNFVSMTTFRCIINTIIKFHSHRDAQSNQQAFISPRERVDMRGSAANTSSRVPWPTMKNVLVGGKTLSLELSWSLKLPLPQSNFHARRYASFASELYATDFKVRASVLDTSIRPWSEMKSATRRIEGSAGWLRDSKINCVWI